MGILLQWLPNILLISNTFEMNTYILIYSFIFFNCQTRRICLPYKTENRPIIGRVLVATRTIKPMELILIDPGTVIGPNYTSKPTCLECLRLVDG